MYRPGECGIGGRTGSSSDRPLVGGSLSPPAPLMVCRPDCSEKSSRLNQCGTCVSREWPIRAGWEHNKATARREDHVLAQASTRCGTTKPSTTFEAAILSTRSTAKRDMLGGDGSDGPPRLSWLTATRPLDCSAAMLYICRGGHSMQRSARSHEAASTRSREPA